MSTLKDLPGWHLQICHREWVLWGYRGNKSYTHIEPAEHVIHVPPMKPIRLPFKLDGRKNPRRKVFERKTCWGWRFRTNNMIHDAGWHLADTREQALIDAKADAQRIYERDPFKRTEITEGLDDVREYGTGLW